MADETINPTIRPPKKPKLYTREQLIEAMQVYNEEVISNPDYFDGKIDTSMDCAEDQIDYLLSKVRD